MDSVYVTEQTFDGVTVRGALIIGSRRALVFDTLISPFHTKEIEKLCPNRELLVVYSHADWDHVWGTCELAPSAVIAHDECANRFADQGDVERTLSEYRIKYPAELAKITLVPPQRTFSSTLTLDLGEITVELRYSPGHTKDSVVGIVPERKLLLGADCIEDPLPILNEDARQLRSWIESLSKLEMDERLVTCLPGHGKIGGRELVTKNKEYLQSLYLDEVQTPHDLDDFYSVGHKENREKTEYLRSARS